MSSSTSGFNVLAHAGGGNIFETDVPKPRVNACFFMPCVDQGRAAALSVVAMFKMHGHGADMRIVPGTKTDLARYEVNACDVPQGLAREIDQIFKDTLEDISYRSKTPAEKLGYGSGIHEVQDDPISGYDRRGGPR